MQFRTAVFYTISHTFIQLYGVNFSICQNRCLPVSIQLLTPVGI